MIQASTATRRIEVTRGNIRNSHFSVVSLHGFLPSDCYGKSGNGAPRPVAIQLEGLGKTVQAIVPLDRRTGKPRRQFQGRAWVREFFQRHDVQEGSTLVIERLSQRTFRLSVTGAPSKYRFVEFFAGIGLVRLSLERHGFVHVFANDIDPEKLAMYRLRFGESGFRLADIRSLGGADVPDCDLATASFPCTDLSIAGAMRGIHSGESSMFWEFMRILQEMKERRPSMVLLENVPGFLKSGNGADLAAALTALNTVGYACDLLQLDASHFVPQSRLRLFVVARLTEGVPVSLSDPVVRSREAPVHEFILSHPEISWNLFPFSRPPQRKLVLKDVLEDLPADHPAWWERERAEYFFNQLSIRHLATAKGMIAASSYSYGTAFRRVRKGRSMAELRTDGIAGCLRTPKGGSGRQILFRAGKGRYSVRLLTARECARLQGVPDDYPIEAPLNQALFGFGDAVCVPVIEWLAEHYFRPALAMLDR